MPSELGRIEKPEAQQFKGQRKIYLVPLVFSPPKPPQGFADLYERYWTGVREQLLKLEGGIGPIARVYHEAVGMGGEEGLAEAEKLNEKSGSIARSKVEAGATMEAVEDEELVTESFDWQRCLMVGLENRRVADMVWGYYNESVRKRFETMAKRIDDSLKAEEAGLLFISEDHRVQFPADIRVFYIAPPALDEIHRWMRDQRNQPGAEGA